jgi:hypothetical protein
MKAILKALGLLVILLIAAIAYVEASSLNQKQTHVTNNSPVNQASTQPIEMSTPSPSPTPKPTLCISDVKLSGWTSDSPDSVLEIESPVNNSVYTTSTITLTIHAKAQSHIILIDVSM